MLNEQAFIGAILLEKGSFLDDVTLSADDFTDPDYRKIFLATVEKFRKGEDFDAVTLSTSLDIEAVLKMHEAMSATPTGKNWAYYEKNIHDDATRRNLKIYANQLLATLTDKEATIDVDHLRKQLDQSFTHEIDDVQFMAQTIHKTIANLDKPARMIPSPWSSINKAIGGFRPGALYIVGARPGVGKTVAGMNIATEIAKSGAVVFISLEMSTDSLHRRVLSDLADVPLPELIGTEVLSKIARDRIKRAESKLTLPLAIHNPKEATVREVRNFARSTNRKMPLKAIVIDYLGLLKGSYGNKSLYEQVSEISRDLKKMAMDLDVPVIALAQLNREVSSRTGQKPVLSDLRDSGSIEQDADVVILLSRDTINNIDEIGIEVAKNRHGATGYKTLDFIGAHSRIVEKKYP